MEGREREEGGGEDWGRRCEGMKANESERGGCEGNEVTGAKGKYENKQEKNFSL